MIPAALAPWLEMVSALSVLALELWVLKRPGESHLPANLARITVLVIWWWSWRRRRRAGLSPPREQYSKRYLAGLTAAVTIAIVMLLALWGEMVREPYDEIHLFFRQLELADWPGWLTSRSAQALTQQIGLQLFLWPVCYEIFGRRRVAAIAAAGIFGLAHLPSPMLVVATFLLALIWNSLYRRGAGLLLLTLSHMALSSLGLALLPERVNYNMHVGRVAMQRAPGYRALAEESAKEKLRILCASEFEARASTDPEGWARHLRQVNLDREPTDVEVLEAKRMLEEGRSPCSVAKLFVSYPKTGRPEVGGS